MGVVFIDRARAVYNALLGRTPAIPAASAPAVISTPLTGLMQPVTEIAKASAGQFVVPGTINFEPPKGKPMEEIGVSGLLRTKGIGYVYDEWLADLGVPGRSLERCGQPPTSSSATAA
jgi:hypothetical protein